MQTESALRRVRVVDSHTGGEPTRVVIEGGPNLQGDLRQRLRQFREQHDAWRAAIVNEPRGSELLVGALLMSPVTDHAAASVIFFNNVGFLGMCGHGTIGVMTTLAWLGRVRPGTHAIDTPVGTVHTQLHQDGEVSVRNVPAFRHLHAVDVQVPGYGEVRGDVAWGGNWFFLVERTDLALAVGDLPALLDFTNRIRAALEREGVTGVGGALIDHIEICGRSHDPSNDGRNFVLCPGGAYDRSPCGTGTSARLACLYADGRLAPGREWRQESVTGSVFAGRVDVEGGAIVPTIRGSAWITAEATLVFCPGDPLGPPAAAGIMPT